MACHVLQTSVGTVFVCNTTPAAPCAFCGQPSTCLCDWPVEKDERVKVTALQVGDRLTCSIMVRGKLRRELRRIIDISGPGADEAYIRVQVEAEGTYLWRTYAIAHRLAPGTCDEPCCDACHRSVDEGTDYCRAHWRQEEIA